MFGQLRLVQSFAEFHMFRRSCLNFVPTKNVLGCLCPVYSKCLDFMCDFDHQFDLSLH